MGIEFIVGFTVLLFALSLIAEPIARRIHVPHSALLVVLGALVAWITTGLFEVAMG